MNDAEEALQYYQKALSIQIATLEVDHADTTPTRNNISLVPYKCGQFAEALAGYQKTLALEEALVGTGHSTTSRALNRIGNCLKGLGDFKGALAEYHKALEVVDAEHAFADMIQENISSVQQEN